MKRDDTLLLLQQISDKLDQFSEFSGKLVSWLVLAMVLLVSYDVAMRYYFLSGSIALQEMEWHLFSLIFLIGAAYTLKHDDHVRLDLFYKSRFMNDQHRAWVNLLGSLLLLIPFCILIITTSWPFVFQAYIHLEGSPDPGGLPYRWILKAGIPLGFTLLLLQGVADIAKNLKLILRDKS
ncbi:MAG: C4-dicarboxylate ABC transporter permease [Gammaproteobacteria bacterium]|nr:MAG: C4-dicarboxylate ABC transporter permease [Gammaproteobacteria bacterium]RKZ71839.1 MAG: C4-dicarboxylate ABC transporter permease [Gammaproteobacteria bacterium]